MRAVFISELGTFLRPKENRHQTSYHFTLLKVPWLWNLEKEITWSEYYHSPEYIPENNAILNRKQEQKTF